MYSRVIKGQGPALSFFERFSTASVGLPLPSRCTAAHLYLLRTVSKPLWGFSTKSVERPHAPRRLAWHQCRCLHATSAAVLQVTANGCTAIRPSTWYYDTILYCGGVDR